MVLLYLSDSHTTLLKCNAIKFDAAYESLAWAFIFYFAKFAGRVEWFYFNIRLYIMSGEEFCFFIQVFVYEQVDTEQVSLMIKLSDLKQNSLSTRHG